MSASARSQLALAVDLRDASLLLVDDTPEQSEEMLITLTEAGFKVMTAASGPQAKQKLMQGGVDLVLLDLKAADMDSYELCRQIKAPPQMRSVPVIFLSDRPAAQVPALTPAPGRDDVEARVRAFRSGAADNLHRDIDFAELLVRLEHHIRLGRKLRELERERAELLRENRDLKKERQSAPPPILTNLADLPSGYVLDQKYRLDTRIGSGGFGVVYRATHLSLQRSVAVKLFRPMANGSTDDALRRFKHEGTSASRLSHPNAVTMLDSGVAPGGIPYLAMELLVGRTLAEELKERNRLGFARCLQIILPVCDVLIEAHAAGIVHRDIKPENVFLHRTRSGEVIKVLDFGIAKLVGEGEGIPAVTGAGGFIGTPTYMAPERLRQGSYDGRSDVYSIGVVLYQMLAGRPPFWSEKDSYLEIVLGHLSEPPRSLSDVNPSVSAPVTQIVMRTLEKDPGLRPTAKELLKELMRLMRRSTGQHEMIEGPRGAEPGASSPGLQPVSALGLPPLPSSKSQPPGSNPLLSSLGSSPPSATSPMNAAERKDFEDEDTGVALPTAVTIELDKRLIEQTSAQASGQVSGQVSGPASGQVSGQVSGPASGQGSGPIANALAKPVSGPLSGPLSGQSSGHTSGK